MKKAKVTFFISGTLKDRVFEYYSWATMVNDMNNYIPEGDIHGWINENEIIKIEVVPV